MRVMTKTTIRTAAFILAESIMFIIIILMMIVQL